MSPPSSVPSITRASAAERARLFQLYLLAAMRPGPAVDGGLHALGASREEMRGAAEAVRATGLEQLEAGLGPYRELLGEPRRAGPALGLPPASPLSGSQAYAFRLLPLWPAFDFLVHEHPSGFVWGLRFARAAPAPTPAPITSIGDLRPWSLVREEFLARCPFAQQEDAWGTFCDYSLWLPSSPGGAMHEVVVGFDFDLLHLVTVV
jgi:hypothetical protein